MDLATLSIRRRAHRPSLLERLRRGLAARRSRRRLEELDAYLLRDIGLTESEARHEAERPFWDAPGHWRR